MPLSDLHCLRARRFITASESLKWDVSQDAADLSGKVHLITGSNCGIGFEECNANPHACIRVHIRTPVSVTYAEFSPSFPFVRSLSFSPACAQAFSWSHLLPYLPQPTLSFTFSRMSQAAKEVARRKGTVHMLCRNAERGEAARLDIIAHSGNPQVPHIHIHTYLHTCSMHAYICEPTAMLCLSSVPLFCTGTSLLCACRSLLCGCSLHAMVCQG